MADVTANAVIHVASHSFKRAWAMLRKGIKDNKIDKFSISSESGLKITEDKDGTSVIFTRTFTSQVEIHP
jgi:hypothetical protein